MRPPCYQYSSPFAMVSLPLKGFPSECLLTVQKVASSFLPFACKRHYETWCWHGWMLLVSMDFRKPSGGNQNTILITFREFKRPQTIVLIIHIFSECAIDLYGYWGIICTFFFSWGSGWVREETSSVSSFWVRTTHQWVSTWFLIGHKTYCSQGKYVEPYGNWNWETMCVYSWVGNVNMGLCSAWCSGDKPINLPCHGTWGGPPHLLLALQLTAHTGLFFKDC